MALHHDAFPEIDRDLRFFPLGVESPSVLTRTQIDQYNAQGYLAPIRVFDPTEMKTIRDYVDDLLDRAMADGWGNYELIDWHNHCEGLYELVTHARVLDVIGDLLGETLILRRCHLFAKLPHDGMRVSWHQDASYWPLSPSKVVSGWLAIDDSDDANGAMQVRPGSHLAAQVPFADSDPDERNVLNQTVPNPDDYGTAKSLILKAGEMSLHSDWTLHGSEPNSSDRRRCGLAMRFLSSDVRAFNGWNEDSVICRGHDESGHWANNPRPAGDSIPARPPR